MKDGNTTARAIADTGAQARKVQFELHKLRESGILIDLDTTGTSKFISRAKWSEIGISDSDALRELFTSGSKYFARDYYKQLRSKSEGARQLTQKFAKDVTGFRPWLWLPLTAYDEWKEGIDKYIAEFDEIKRDLLRNYDALCDDYKKHIATDAERAWNRLSIDGATSVTVDGVKFERKSGFVDHVIAQAENKIPTKGELRDTLALSYASAVLDSDDIGGALVDYERARAESETIRAQSRLQQAQLYQQEQAAYAEARTAEAKSQAEQQAIYAKMREEQESRAARLAAIRETEAANARKRLTEIASPFEEVFDQVRGQFVEAIEKGLDSYKKNGRIPGKTAEMLRGLPDLFRLVSIGKDDELLGKLEELRGLCAVGSDDDKETKRDQSAIKAKLDELKGIVTSTADEVKRVHGRFAYLEV